MQRKQHSRLTVKDLAPGDFFWLPGDEGRCKLWIRGGYSRGKKGYHCTPYHRQNGDPAKAEYMPGNLEIGNVYA